MKDALDGMVHSTIEGLESIHDYVQLLMDRCILSIYTPATYRSVLGEGGRLDANWSMARGHAIAAVSYCEGAYVELCLDDGAAIRISLCENDYSGPEALSLHFGDGSIVVV